MNMEEIKFTVKNRWTDRWAVPSRKDCKRRKGEKKGGSKKRVLCGRVMCQTSKKPSNRGVWVSSYIMFPSLKTGRTSGDIGVMEILPQTVYHH